ncbi:MAG: hypothetical protein U5K32_12920 [Bacteroidales bacterium]|nr:hypothetical protein [Bacteroidales bacterium]
MQQNPFTELEKRLESIENKLSALTARPEPQPKGEEKYLTIDQTAELLSVTRPTLWAWNKKGILTSITDRQPQTLPPFRYTGNRRTTVGQKAGQ